MTTSASRIIDAGRAESHKFPQDSFGGLGKGAARDPHEIEREAFEKGFESGERAGMQVAEKKTEAVLKRFSESIDELARLRDEVIQQTERDLVSLSVRIAEALVQREIELDEQIVVALIRKATEKLRLQGRVEVFVNGDDLEYLQNDPDSALAKDDGMNLKARDGLNRGECVVESDYGTVDGRLGPQLNEIEKSLLEGES